MKVPLLWLKDYLKIDTSPSQIATSFTQLGLMLDKPIDPSDVLDLEHRMDRSDWLSIIGCARDLAAFEKLALTLPKSSGKPGKIDKSVSMRVTVSTPAVRRFQTRILKGVKVGPSPSWMTDRLSLYGIEPINNIVDITNFVMVEYGQPIHAQDIAKLKEPEITIRQAKKDEKLVTLLGTELTLDTDAFVLTSGGEATVLGGIVGGKKTGVTSKTVDIVLDSGNYDPRVIRKVSRRLKVLNESVMRNDKFLDPKLIDTALDRTTNLILEIAGGTYYTNDDYYPNPSVPKSIALRDTRLKLIAGMPLSLASAKTILARLEYVVTDETEENLTVEIPYFRTDVEVEDDLIADILRISNYDQIPSTALTTPVPRDITPPIYHFEERLRDIMTALGAHEHITNSLVAGSDNKHQIKLQNALTTDQSALRVSIEETLSKAQITYQKHRASTVPLFEIGKVYWNRVGSGGDQWSEERHLTVITEEPQLARDLLSSILDTLGVAYHLEKSLGSASIISGEKAIGYIVPKSFSLFTESIIDLAKPYGRVVSEFTHSQKLDLSFEKSKAISFGEIHQSIMRASPTLRSLATIDGDTARPLIKLEWPESTDVHKEKEKIVKSLKAMGLTSRSD